MIVLDDVWQAHDVFALLRVLNESACRCIVTTRSPRVALTLAAGEAIRQIAPLTEEESLTLLQLQAIVPGHKRPLLHLFGGLALGLLLAGDTLRTASYQGGSSGRLTRMLDRFHEPSYRLTLTRSPETTFRFSSPSIQDAFASSIAALSVAAQSTLYQLAHDC